MTTASKVPYQLGPFTISGLLGAGGMGEVYLGRRNGPEGFTKVVVLKRLLPVWTRVDSIRRLFIDEAHTLAKIRHRNVVQVHELFEHDDELFIVMEYLEGESLNRIQEPSISGPLSLAESVYLVAEVCAGLHAAHALVGVDGQPGRIIHRDIKPSNIFVTYDGDIKLIDFGIAKSDAQIHTTKPGHVRGTADYMSPEQVLGLPLDTRSDIFSVGTVLYEVTTGRRLFKRDHAYGTQAAILHEPITPPRQIHTDYPALLEDVCLRCLARERNERYQDCRTLRGDLEEVLATLVTDASPADELAQRMARAFASDIARKRALVRSVHIEQPQSNRTAPVTETTSANTATAGLRIPDTPPSRFASVAAAAVAAIAAAIIIEVFSPPGWRTWTGSKPEDASVARVSIRIETVPPGAAVLVTGRFVGHSPVHFAWVRTERSIPVELRRSGYVTRRIDVTPSSTTRLSIELQPDQPSTSPTKTERPPRRRRQTVKRKPPRPTIPREPHPTPLVATPTAPQEVKGKESPPYPLLDDWEELEAE